MPKEGVAVPRKLLRKGGFGPLVRTDHRATSHCLSHKGAYPLKAIHSGGWRDQQPVALRPSHQNFWNTLKYRGWPLFFTLDGRRPLWGLLRGWRYKSGRNNKVSINKVVQTREGARRGSEMENREGTRQWKVCVWITDNSRWEFLAINVRLPSI